MEEGEEENYQPPPEKSIDALMEADQVAILNSLQQFPHFPTIYDKVSDVVESRVRFASKILEPHRMH